MRKSNTEVKRFKQFINEEFMNKEVDINKDTEIKSLESLNKEYYKLRNTIDVDNTDEQELLVIHKAMGKIWEKIKSIVYKYRTDYKNTDEQNKIIDRYKTKPIDDSNYMM
jgi:hypothetical protein